MRLYSRTGAEQAVHDGETYHRQPDGGFEFPEHVGEVLRTFHVSKTPLWETLVEQQQRLIAEDRQRRSDPSSQYDLLERIATRAEGVPDPAAEIAALRRELAELKAAAQPADDGSHAARAPRTRKTTATADGTE